MEKKKEVFTFESLLERRSPKKETKNCLQFKMNFLIKINKKNKKILDIAKI